MIAPVLGQSSSLSEIRDLTAQGRYQDAYRQLETYIETRPADEQARLLRGVLLTRLNRVDEAIDAFQQLARDNPNLAEPHNNLAVLFAAQGRFEEARRALLDAIALQSDYDIARENLGDIYARLANIEYRRAHEVNRNNIRAREKAETIGKLFESIRASEAVATPLPEPATEPVPEPSAASAPTVATGDPAERCLIISSVIRAWEVEGKEITAWLERRGARIIKTGLNEEGVAAGFQIHVPPLPDREQANALVEKMKQSGVTHLYLIESGALAGGISLGVYKTESASARRMAKLRELGFEVERRELLETSTTFEIEVDVRRSNLEPAEVNQTFADFDAEPTPCP
ncbi:MAG TPA: tetratricopeptide repeat protein [Gammaproteobacteria bacterium]